MVTVKRGSTVFHPRAAGVDRKDAAMIGLYSKDVTGDVCCFSGVFTVTRKVGMDNSVTLENSHLKVLFSPDTALMDVSHIP